MQVNEKANIKTGKKKAKVYRSSDDIIIYLKLLKKSI